MVIRRLRPKVVIDTNVFVRFADSSRPDSFNRQVVERWLLYKRIELVVSPELVAEYLRIFDSILTYPRRTLTKWHRRFMDEDRVTVVELGPRVVGSRDPDDDLLLSVAKAGHADTLVTNDRDLLDLPRGTRQKLPFAIVTPREFLHQFL